MKKRLDVTIDPKCIMSKIACALFFISAFLRIWHYGAPAIDTFTRWVQLIMPVSAAVVFLLGMALGGNAAKPAVTAATVIGVAFFIIKATTFEPLHQALCTVLYTAVLVLFTATLWGLLPTKILLYPLFGLPLLYHIFVEDTKLYFFAEPPVPVWYWMPEISVLCIMAGLLCLSIGLDTKKHRID